MRVRDLSGLTGTATEMRGGLAVIRERPDPVRTWAGRGGDGAARRRFRAITDQRGRGAASTSFVGRGGGGAGDHEFDNLRVGDIVRPVKLPETLAGWISLGVGVLGAILGTIATVVWAVMNLMIAPLATKADVAALPTRADVAAVDLRETVAALSATVDAQREAQREASDAQREAIADLRATVDALSATVAQASNTVIALSSNVDQIRETADRMGDTVDTLGGRLDSLSNIISPLVPCIVELHHPPWVEGAETGRPLFTDAGTPPQLPESCEQARERARQAQ